MKFSEICDKCVIKKRTLSCNFRTKITLRFQLFCFFFFVSQLNYGKVHLGLQYTAISRTVEVNFNSILLFPQVNNNIPGINIFCGKIINLVIDCRVIQTTQRVQFDSGCLLFKLEGNTTCKFDRSTPNSGYGGTPM